MPGPVSPEDDESAGRVVDSLGSSPAERDRLRRQSAELREHSELLLDRVGSPRGGGRSVDQAVREHLSDPGTLMLPHLLFLAWGRKPDGAVTP